jgi:hypothetical protein
MMAAGLDFANDDLVGDAAALGFALAVCKRNNNDRDDIHEPQGFHVALIVA